MSDDTDMAVDGGEVSEDVAVDGAAASFVVAAEGAGLATGAGGVAGCVDVHAALPDAASPRAAARPSRQALLAEVAERRERVRSLVLTLLKAGIPVELDADVASISADCVGCSGSGEADRGCAGPGGVSDGTAGAGDGRGDDALAGWPREICACAGDAGGALGPGARSSSEGERRCSSGNGGDGCNGCNGMHGERGVDSDAGTADVRAMDARSVWAGSGRGLGGWPLSSSRPSSASGALLPRPSSGASLSRPGSASADFDEPRLGASHPPPPPHLHPHPHPHPPPPPHLHPRSLPACPPSSVLPSAAALAALDPREWRVPPLCVPILANVTTFPWASLASRAQFDAVLLDPPWRLATANPTRGVALGYSQLEDRDVLSIPIGALQPMHGLVFLYTINAKIAFSIACLNAWGYELVGEVAWTKLTVNRRLAKSHGFYLQHAKETCLVGRKVRNVVDGTAHDHQSGKNATATTTTTRVEDDAMEDDALPKDDATEDDTLPKDDMMEDDALPKDAGVRDAASSDPSKPSRTPSEATTAAPPESATACPGPGDCSTTEVAPTAAPGSTATAAPVSHNPPSPDAELCLEASRRCSQTNGPNASTGAPSSARRIPFPSAETVMRHLERTRGDAALAAARKAVAARRRALARRAALLRGEEAGTDAHYAGTEKRREQMDAEEEGKGLGAAEEKRDCGFPLAQTPFASSEVDPSRRQDAPADGDAAHPGTRFSPHPSSTSSATPPPPNASAPAPAPPTSRRTNVPLLPSSSSPAEFLASTSAPPRYLAPSSDLLLAMRRGQSQKPEETYALIERLVPGGRYLEIFGRKNNLHDGWVTIGNEVTGQGRPEDDDKAVAEGKRAPGAVYGRNMRS